MAGNSNGEIAFLLRSVASAYLLKNENRFKIIAYQKAADAIEHLTRELKNIWSENPEAKVPGIGPSIQSHLLEYFKTDASKHFNSVFEGIPSTVFILMKIPTIGPKTAYKLVQELKLHDETTVVAELKQACLNNKIASIPTFGEKSQRDILKAIELYQNNRDQKARTPIGKIAYLVNELIVYLEKSKLVKRIDVLGSMRRKVSMIGDIDLAVVVDPKDSDNLIKYFTQYHGVLTVENEGDKKASIIVTPNIKVDLRVQDEATYGSMLQYFTGSKAHNIKLREFALKKGYSLSEYGIKLVDEAHKKYLKPNYNEKSGMYEFSSEVEFYNFLGLSYIPPEIREGTNEIALAQKHDVPALVEVADIKGDLHVHSSYDIKTSHDVGLNTYAEIVKKSEQLGYEYIGFADHNPKVSGHKKDDIVSIMKARKDYIDELIRSSKFERTQILTGLETDISPSGELALPTEAIEYVDYLVVSIHSSFDLPIKEMTARVLKALTYPKVRIFGHPTGRLLGKRGGIQLDWSKVFPICKERKIALEINAGPERLDLPDTLVKEGIDYGCVFTIDTDAHAAAHMDKIEYGVSVARRGWATKSVIMNTLPYKEFKDWIDFNN